MQLPIVLDRAPAPWRVWPRRRSPNDVKREPVEAPIVPPPHPLQDPAAPWWSDAQLW